MTATICNFMAALSALAAAVYWRFSPPLPAPATWPLRSRWCAGERLRLKKCPHRWTMRAEKYNFWRCSGHSTVVIAWHCASVVDCVIPVLLGE